jgi:hypothetical protein
VEELASCDHGHGLDVGRHVAEDGQETVEQRLETLVTGGDDLVEDDDLEKNRFRTCFEPVLNLFRTGFEPVLNLF